MKINKTILGLMTGCFILFSFTEKNTPDEFKNDLKEMNLFGKVQSLKETIYKPVAVSADPKSGGIRIESTTNFNESGNKTEESGYDLLLGNKGYKSTFEYDDKGNRSLELSYKDDGSLRKKYIFKYDDKGYVTEKSVYNPADSLLEKFIYKTDDRGNKTEQLFLIGSNVTGSRSTYKYVYDKAGNIIERTQYNSDGKVDMRVTYSLDEKGNIIQQKSYHSSNKLMTSMTTKYTFDKSGNWIFKKIIIYAGYSDETNLQIILREIKYY